MKTTLINPPMSLEEQSGKSSMKVVTNILLPLGIGYIAAVLEQNNQNVKIVDCQPQDIRHNELRDILEKERPDIIGFTATTLSYPSTLKAARDAREVLPDATLVIGGPHFTAAPQKTMANGAFDIGVMGEGEMTLLELVQKITDGESVKEVEGIFYHDNGKLVFTGTRPFIKDLDSLPFPARHLFPSLSKYHPTPASCRTTPLATIMTSRGCPNKCTFCDRKVFGRVTRFRSPDNVLDEIEEAIEKHGAREIKFFDDTFTLNQKRVLEICKGIKERGIDIEWSCLTRVNTVSGELLKEMKKAGCWQVLYGMESGDQEMLDRMKKGITLEQGRKAVAWSREAKLNIRACFVAGTPGETVESIQRTVDFAKSLDLDAVNFYAFAPLPGTEIYDNLIDEGTLLHEDWEQYNVMVSSETAKMPYVPEGITEEQFKDIISRAHRSFYFRPKYIIRQILRTRGVDDLKRYLYGFLAIKGL
jgi:radical SAM superfamily enzyme YgiQ (UPF0313 family)